MRFIYPSVLLWLAVCPGARALDYQIEANIRYDHYAETVLDILQPAAPSLADRPGVLFIHGGGVEGDKESRFERYCLPFVRRGMVVANVDYRLAEAAPAAVNDVLKAAEWFLEHAARYKVDRKRILVAGDSAGGQLALMTAMTPTSAGLGPSIRIAAVVDFFGIADVADAQPGRMKSPPILVLHGDADPLASYEQSVSLVKALKNAGHDAELIIIPGGPQQMDQLWPQVFQWLKKRKIN